MLDPNSKLWQYLSEPQRQLLQEGFYLLDDVKQHMPIFRVTDYSFIVFPFAKAYEGFLKQLFFDMGLIKKWQFESDHFRIGKVLSPGLVKLLRKQSVYGKLCNEMGECAFAERLWSMWKRGRNGVFHYFADDVRGITLDDAESLAHEFISVMEEAMIVYDKHRNHG